MQNIKESLILEKMMYHLYLPSRATSEPGGVPHLDGIYMLCIMIS